MSECKKNNLIVSKILLFLLFLVLIWTGIVCAKTIYKKQQMVKENANLKAEASLLQEQNNDLRELKSLFGSRDFLEKEAKMRLNLKKGGEEVIIVPENESAGATTSDIGLPEQKNATEKELSNLEKWKIYFFH